MLQELLANGGIGAKKRETKLNAQHRPNIFLITRSIIQDNWTTIADDYPNRFDSCYYWDSGS